MFWSSCWQESGEVQWTENDAMCFWHHIYVSERTYALVKTPAWKASPRKWLPVASCSHSLIKAFLCGPVSLIVLSAQVEESGRLDEVIDHQAAAFLAVAALQRRAWARCLCRRRLRGRAWLPACGVTRRFYSPLPVRIDTCILQC